MFPYEDRLFQEVGMTCFVLDYGYNFCFFLFIQSFTHGCIYLPRTFAFCSLLFLPLLSLSHFPALILSRALSHSLSLLLLCLPLIFCPPRYPLVPLSSPLVMQAPFPKTFPFSGAVPLAFTECRNFIDTTVKCVPHLSSNFCFCLMHAFGFCCPFPSPFYLIVWVLFILFLSLFLGILQPQTHTALDF